MSLVVVDKGPVTKITLNRPDRLNALTVDMGEAFADVIDSLRGDTDVRAVVLTGAGRAFSAGGDLEFLRARQADTPDGNAREMKAFYKRFLSMRTLGVPLVAAINGHAIGAGMCLALACDVRIAAPSAKLGLTFVGLGLHPGMGATHLLPALAGPQVAARLLLTGDTVDAATMERLGVVASVDDDCVSAAMHVADRIAQQGPLAVRQTLQTLRERQDADIERALTRESQCQAANYASADLAEGITALQEKRKPVFGGR